MKTDKKSKSRSLRTSFLSLNQDDPLESLIYNTTEEWYDAKHPSFSFDEIKLVNSMEIKNCPYCNLDKSIKNGKRKDGIQTYKCLTCGRRFNPITGTLFDSRKIPISEWIEFLVHLFQYESLTVSAIDNRNTQSTGRYWTKKVFETLKHYQDNITLGDTFWIDETYVKIEPSKITKDDKNRKLRGLSHDKICIVTATDGTNSILYAAGYGKPSSNKILNVMEGKIKPCSNMIDDAEKAHRILVDTYSLNRQSFPSYATKGLKDKNNPLNTINTLHKFFKKFIAHHGSYDRDEIQDWCNLFSFMYNHNGIMSSMVTDFLKLAISTKKVMRYREVMQKKS